MRSPTRHGARATSLALTLLSAGCYHWFNVGGGGEGSLDLRDPESASKVVDLLVESLAEKS